MNEEKDEIESLRAFARKLRSGSYDGQSVPAWIQEEARLAILEADVIETLRKTGGDNARP